MGETAVDVVDENNEEEKCETVETLSLTENFGLYKETENDEEDEFEEEEDEEEEEDAEEDAEEGSEYDKSDEERSEEDISEEDHSDEKNKYDNLPLRKRVVSEIYSPVTEFSQ